MRTQPRYLAYLLRLWHEGDGESAEWRASLESPLEGEQRRFARLLDLYAFLDEETDSFRPASALGNR